MVSPCGMSRMARGSNVGCRIFSGQWQMERYKEGPRGKPPHVFGVGHRAYYDMLNERKPQVRR